MESEKGPTDAIDGTAGSDVFDTVDTTIYMTLRIAIPNMRVGENPNMKVGDDLV